MNGLAETAESCTGLSATLPANLAGGSYQLTVVNPGAGACVSSALTLLVIPAPAVASVSPAQTCDSSSALTISVSGTGFLQTSSALPTVAFLGGAAGRG